MSDTVEFFSEDEGFVEDGDNTQHLSWLVGKETYARLRKIQHLRRDRYVTKPDVLTIDEEAKRGITEEVFCHHVAISERVNPFVKQLPREDYLRLLDEVEKKGSGIHPKVIERLRFGRQSQTLWRWLKPRVRRYRNLTISEADAELDYRIAEESDAAARRKSYARDRTLTGDRNCR